MLKRKNQTLSCVYLWERGSVRVRNEDAICIRSVRTARGICALYCICDGMGGCGRGMEAAKLSISRIEEWYDRQLLSLLEKWSRHPLSVSNGMRKKIIKNSGLKMFQKLNEELFKLGRKEKAIWGCTASMCVVVEGCVYWFHVGDSAIFRSDRMKRGMTDRHRAKDGALTRCLGGNRDGKVDFGLAKLGNSRYLICSDGFLCDMTWRRLRDILGTEHKHKTKEHYKKRLEKIADYQIKNGGTDNMSAILFWKD